MLFEAQTAAAIRRMGNRYPDVLLCALLLAAANPATAAVSPMQHRDVGDMNISLRVSPAVEIPPQIHEADKERLRRLEVVVRKRGTKVPISDAQVSADVAELGFAGREVALEPALVDGTKGYAGYVPMPGLVTYRILVHVRTREGARALEAEFEYHH